MPDELSHFEQMLFSKSLKVKLMNIAMLRTNKNEAEALDLIQNTYLKALESQDSFKGEEIDGWVVTILKNQFIDNTRKGTFKVKQLSRDFEGKKVVEEIRVKREHALGVGSDLPEKEIMDESDSLLLERDAQKCLEQLSDKEKELLALKQSSSYDEISTDLNIKSGTLRQMFVRAKERFMKCMGFINE